MTLELYSVFATLGTIALFAISLFTALGYALSSRFRAYLMTFSYARYLLAIGVISLASVVGAMVYQLAYLTPVCELCWWQRIFLFPISVIALVGARYRAYGTHMTVLILSLIGLFYSAYHYYYHFQGLVLGNILSLPCSSGGLLPACTESPILTFGFSTIPFMGIMVFGSMILLALVAHMRGREAGAQTL